MGAGWPSLYVAITIGLTVQRRAQPEQTVQNLLTYRSKRDLEEVCEIVKKQSAVAGENG